MRVPIQEYEIVGIIKDNLKEGLVQFIYPKNIDTIDSSLEEWKRAESNIAKRISYRQQQQTNYRRIHELELQQSDVFDPMHEIEALCSSTAPGRQITCWKCKKSGHSFIICPLEQRNIFCYRCGFDGVTSPMCPQCVGNPNKNIEKSGTPCSHKDSTQQ